MAALQPSGLTPRQASILAAIVEEYVETVAPVGSKAVRERHGIDCSTATIRNEMCVLERGGLIRQPHTSAGRVPADSGYRAYVNDIMPPRHPSLEELASVHSEYRRAGQAVERLYRATSRVLSQLTSAPAMVMAPPEEPVVLTAIRLTPVSSTIVRMEFETEPGGRHECLLESPEPITAVQMVVLAQALIARYGGRDLGAVSLCAPETLQDDMDANEVPVGIIDNIKSALEHDRAQQVYVDGAACALNFPEYQALDQLRPLMEALDEEPTVRRLLRPAARRGRMTVVIGQEQDLRELRRCSLVARHYCAGADHVGALGVIGPTRLDYRTVSAVVQCVADHFAEALANAAGRDEL